MERSVHLPEIVKPTQDMLNMLFGGINQMFYLENEQEDLTAEQISGLDLGV